MNKRQAKKQAKKQESANTNKRIKSRTVHRTVREKKKLRLVAEIQAKGAKANYRLKRLEQVFKTKEIYAGKRLVARGENLDILTSSKYIKLGEKFLNSLGIVELRAILKTIDSFLNSKTSTVQGIREVINNLRKNMGVNYNFTAKEIDLLIEMFENSAVEAMYEYFEPSELWDLVDEAKLKAGDSASNFRKIVYKYYLDTNNKEFKVDLENFITYMWGTQQEKEEMGLNRASKMTASELKQHYQKVKQRNKKENDYSNMDFNDIPDTFL